MFVDRVIVTFVSGKGGDGCVSFRREKFVPKGGPDGGDGGKGGDVILVANGGIESLIDFKFKHEMEAENGGSGMGKKMYGRDGKDLVISVPPGTLVKSFPEERLLFDFHTPGMELVLLRGGKGGRGNFHFRSSVNQAPRRADKGETGETMKVILELKLIAFAGLVGLPNAGKSTLISKISGARPKIADYPFTTLSPNLGVVYEEHKSLVVADIPGIIAGAHRGEGMGIEFLRHIERTRVLVFLIDVSPYTEHGPLETLHILENELRLYQTSMLRKRRLVVANKIDLLGDRRRVSQLQAYCRKNDFTYMEISAVRGQNLDNLKRALFAFHDEQ